MPLPKIIDQHVTESKTFKLFANIIPDDWIITKVTELGYIGFDGEGIAFMDTTFKWAYVPLIKIFELLTENMTENLLT